MLNAELMYLFDATIKHFSSEIYSYYGESLKDPEIDILLKELGIDDGDFKRLYQWKNGIAIAKQDYSIDTSILM